MKRTRFTALLLTGALAAMTPLTTLASTAPCTQISNTASVTYAVGGVDQTSVALGGPKLSNVESFNVGAKILVDVERSGTPEVSVTPGGTAKALKFIVTNNSNLALNFALSQDDAATGTLSPFSALRDDDFDLSAYKIFVDEGDGVYGVGDAEISSIAALNGDGATKAVFIVYDPAALAEPDAAISVNYLTATAKWLNNAAIVAGDPVSLTAAMAGGSCGGGTNVAVVIDDEDGPAGEGADDAADSDVHAYIVSSATIGVSKSYIVVSDPINGAFPNAKAIPGAVVRYTIEIENTGGSSATLSTISDALAGTLQVIATAGNATWAVPASTRAVKNGTLTADTGDTNTDGLGHTNTALVGGTLTANMATILVANGSYAAGELKANEKVTLTFDATIQ